MWRLSSPAPLTLRGWDDQFVLYDRRSGDTHQLTWLGAELLLRLQSSPADEIALVAHVLSGVEYPDEHLATDAFGVDQVATVLRQFHELGLVEPFAA